MKPLPAAIRFLNKDMLEIRVVGPEDAEQVAAQRRNMFIDMGQPDDLRLQAMVEAFIPWARNKIQEGRYRGWFAWENDRPIGGGGMYLMDFPPHWRDAQPLRGYLLNFYVEPQSRRRGVASALLRHAISEAQAMGIRVVSLHASEAGRPIYEHAGFDASNEMMLMMEPLARV